MKLSLSCFFLLTGGYPGIVFVSLYLFVIYAVYQSYRLWRNGGRGTLIPWAKMLLLSLLLSLCLSTVVLLSSFDLRPNINRGAALHTSQDKNNKTVMLGSLPPQALLTFVYSSTGAVQNKIFWKQDFSLINCYFGIIALLAIFFSLIKSRKLKEIQLLVILAVLFIMIALSTVFPFRMWLAEYFPLMNLFRFPTLFRLFSIFCLILASVLSFQFIQGSQLKPQQFARILLYAASFFAMVCFVFFFLIQKWMFKKIITEGYSVFNEMAGIPEHIFLQSFLFSLILLLSSVFISKTNWQFSSIILIAVVIDLFLSVQQNIRATAVEQRDACATNIAIDRMPKSYPIPSLKTLFVNVNDQKLGGSIPNLWLNLAIYAKIPSCEGNSPMSFNIHNEAQRLAGYRASLHHPLLYFKEKDGQINIKSFTPNQIECNISCSSQTDFVYLQNYYPAWSVLVDGIKQRVKLADHAFLSVSLPKGAHHVVFQFRPLKIVIGFYISMITFFIIIFALWGYQLEKVFHYFNK